MSKCTYCGSLAGAHVVGIGSCREIVTKLVASLESEFAKANERAEKAKNAVHELGSWVNQKIDELTDALGAAQEDLHLAETELAQAKRERDALAAKNRRLAHVLETCAELAGEVPSGRIVELVEAALAENEK